MWGRMIGELSVPSSQFCCEPNAGLQQILREGAYRRLQPLPQCPAGLSLRGAGSVPIKLLYLFNSYSDTGILLQKYSGGG